MAGKQGIKIRDNFSIRVFESQMRTLVRYVNDLKPFYQTLNLEKPFHQVAKALYENGIQGIESDIEAFVTKEAGDSNMLRSMILKEIQGKIERLDQEIQFIKSKIRERIYGNSRQTAGGDFFGLEWASEDLENNCLKFGEEELKESGEKLFSPVLGPDVERLYNAAMNFKQAFRTLQRVAAEVAGGNVVTVDNAVAWYFSNNELEDVDTYFFTEQQLKRNNDSGFIVLG